LNASDGYFHMVFTATLGQDFWRQVMEPREDEDERFPDGQVVRLALRFPKVYIDDSPSPWTDEKIAGVEGAVQDRTRSS
jgi:hypothetical protein